MECAHNWKTRIAATQYGREGLSRVFWRVELIAAINYHTNG
jgi:hypothetical protein